MLDDLLDVSRVSHNKFELRKTIFNLQRYCYRCAWFTQIKSGAKWHWFAIIDRGKADSCFCRSRSDSTCQVNLVGNAIKFTKNGDKLIFDSNAWRHGVHRSQRQRCRDVRVLSQHTFELFSQGANEPRHKESGIGVGSFPGSIDRWASQWSMFPLTAKDLVK